ncbi:MAG: asparaginase [Alphaproteobacteria bacterium]|nr:asparaginase [Alphaproteobacteria bacterium]
MAPHDHAPPDIAPSPILVEELRGTLVELIHRGRAVVVDPSGGVSLSWGDPELPVYPRSSIKPLQAIPLIESGAADAFGLSDTEIALACASHGGETEHVAAVEAWLKRVGLSVNDLECGAHPPGDPVAAEALARAGKTPTAAHNNCSGKHAAMLTTALHKGEKTRGYIARTHPVQQRILGLLEQLSGSDLGAAPTGIDGCGIPVFALGLGNLALAFARFADPVRLPERRAQAIARIGKAMLAAPFFVAGSGNICTELLTLCGGEVLPKTGAAGVFAAALPGVGLGVALKIEDGSCAAAEIVMLAILARLGIIGDTRRAALNGRLKPQIYNSAGTRVGELRPAEVLANGGAPH